ncbi:MAG: hypothetical protein K6E79_04550 [Pseudobutyrivibrio sp.]|nr:hypothetical protein [Pseudobutyrivibrio sp.]
MILKNKLKNTGNKKKLKNRKEKRSYGLTGAGSGLGTTHISLALANYMHSVLKKKVVFIEYSSKSNLISMFQDKNVSLGPNDGYMYKGVEYLLHKREREILDVINKVNAYIVIDCGCDFDSAKAILDHCDNKIVIGSMKPWRQREYIKYVNKNIVKNYDISKIKYLIDGKELAEIKLFYSFFKRRPVGVSNIQNPFRLREEDFDIINEIMA